MSLPVPWMLELQPNWQISIAPASSGGLIERAVAAVGRGPVDWAVQHGHAMALTIVREMPQFADTADGFEILRMGTEATTVQSLVRLATGAVEKAATSEALDGVVDFVRRGIGLDSVLRGIRLGHAEMARAFLEGCECLAPPGDRIAEAKRVSDELFDYIDAFSASMTEQFVQEQIRWSTSELAAKRELVTHLLKDGLADTGEASRRLGFPLAATHRALILWTDAFGADADTFELQRTASNLFRGLPVTPRLILPVSSGTLWVWVSGESDMIEPLRHAVAQLPAHLHVSAGRPSAGLAGFRLSHQQAAAAALLAQSTNSSVSAGLVVYEDVEVLSLLLHDRHRAIEFASHALGPLWNDQPQTVALRSTLRAYLEAQSSTQTVARRMHLARNTVSYRVQRAEELLNGSVEGRALEILTALVIADAVSAS